MKTFVVPCKATIYNTVTELSCSLDVCLETYSHVVRHTYKHRVFTY
jgi:hypothetical protein